MWSSLSLDKLVQGPNFGQDSHRPPFILGRLLAIGLHNNPLHVVNSFVLDQPQPQVTPFGLLKFLLANDTFLCIAVESGAFNESGEVSESCFGGFEDGKNLVDMDLILVGLESDQSSGVLFSESMGV